MPALLRNNSSKRGSISGATTSMLAKALNTKLSNSIVYRHDLLAGLKAMPFGNLTKTSQDAGSYLGDIESIDLKNVSEETINKAKGLFQFFSGTNAKNQDSFERFLVNDSLDKFSKRIMTFNSASLAIVNIFSGTINENLLSETVKKLDDCLIISIKDDSKSLLPIEVTEEQIEKLTNDENCMYLGNHNTIDALLESEEFKSLFGDFKENEVKPEAKKVKSAAFDEDDAIEQPINEIEAVRRAPGMNIHRIHNFAASLTATAA